MKQILVFFALLCLLTNLNAAPSRPRHIVVFVHGLLGGQHTFGAMGDALKSQLAKADSTYSWDVATFLYDTRSTTKTTFFFAEDLAQFIDAYFKKTGDIQPDDRISLVTHSQGGLIGAIWLWGAYHGTPKYFPEYLSHVDSFVMLATPFWGSQMADLVYPFSSWLNAAIPASMQIHEMAFSSQTTFNFRRILLSPEEQPFIQEIVPKVRPLTIGGATQIPNLPGILAGGLRKYEGDFAVHIPSTRLDFVYARSLKEVYSENDLVTAGDFHETNFAPFIEVDAIHGSGGLPTPPFGFEIAKVQGECVANIDCGHPSFHYIVDHLAHRPFQIPDELVKKSTSFLMEVSVVMPDKMDPHEINVEFPPEVLLDNSITRLTNVSVNRAEGKRFARFHFLGHLRRTWLQTLVGLPPGPLVVPFKVTAPGAKTRLVDAKIKATYMTFVELNLEYQ